MSTAERVWHQTLIVSMRQYLIPVMKGTFGNHCAGCKQEHEKYEIDHIKYAPDITIHDLQLLCRECHKDKTNIANEHYILQMDHCATCTCWNM